MTPAPSRRSRFAWLAAGLFAAGAGGAGAAGDAGPAPADAVYDLTLDPGVSEVTAAPGHTAVTVRVYAQGGRCVHAWARTSENNSAVWAADASGLRTDGSRLVGDLRIVHRMVAYDYRLDCGVSGRAVRGAFDAAYGASAIRGVEGVVTGLTQVAFARAERAVLDFALGKPIVGGNEWQRMARMSLVWEDGRFTAARFYPHRGGAWSGAVERLNVTLADGEFSGDVTAAVTNRGGIHSGRYAFTLRGRVAGGGVAGSYRRRLAGQADFDGDLMGTVSAWSAAPDAAARGWRLDFVRGVQSNELLRVCLDGGADGFAPGFAVAPNHAWKMHRIGRSGLSSAGDRVSGTFDVAINPAGWGVSIWEWDFGGARPVAYRFRVDVAASNGVVSGRYAGQWMPRALGGRVSGAVRSWDEVRRDESLAPGNGYPAWRGDGSGSGSDGGRPLVDSLEQARPVWRSTERTPDAWLWSRPVNPGLPGGYGSPVVADGRVFVFYQLPGGTNYASGAPDPCDKTRRPMPGFIDADDVMLCLDASTGATLWKTAFAAAGLNFNGGAGPHMTPCAAMGRVFGVGSAGAVYGLDARDGAVLWRTTLGPEAERMEALRAECHRTRLMPVLNLDFCGACVVADGVLVCNDNREGLVGFDVRTGERVWGPVSNCVRKTSSPAVWGCGGTNYIVAAFRRAVCLDPRTGRQVWQLTNGVSCEGSVAIDGDYLVTGGGGAGGTGMTCYRMTPTNAVRHWSAGGKWNSHVTTPVIHRGHAYCFGDGGSAVCVELATGRIAGTAWFYSVRSCSSFVAMGGRVVRPHLYSKVLFYDADAAGFRQLGEPWVAPSFAENTTPAVADGRMFFRGKDAVFCYDLRKP